MEEIAKALELKNELDNLRPIDKEKEAIIMQKFRLDWNYHSNHLEGNSLTYGETKALILFGITAQGKPLKDTLEITGHNEAINWVIDLVKGERPLTENFIRELHTLLLKEPYEVDAITPDGKPTKKLIKVGSYKTTANHVKTKTGEIFYFATPEETPAKMFDLLNWYQQKSKESTVNPILVSAEFHYRFIRIHPFDDGNGRMARIIMNFILMQFGFPPVIIKTEDKANYFAALQMADAGNIETFVNYIAHNLNRSLEIMIAGAKGESIEEEDDLDKEIALLEQKLNGFGAEIKEVKSIDNVTNVVNNSIIKLSKSLNEKFLIFEKYYVNNRIDLMIDGTSIDFIAIDDVINYAFDGMKYNSFIRITNNGLKKQGLEDFSFYEEISIHFDDLKYRIISKQIKEFNISKNYYENLSEKEIDKLVAIVIRYHNKILEKKIAEKENK